MKFLYADSLDYVDPNYNFLEDRSSPGREPYWDDQFMHEYLGEAPCDGYLISRGIVGDHKFSGTYTQSQAQRFRRDGARKFLRIDNEKFDHLMLMGDCGAYSYHKENIPPYTPREILEFYEDGKFSHGCSVDHIIFAFDKNLKGMEALRDPGNTDAGIQTKERWDITQENAEAFFKESSQMTTGFTPLGVIQGWSPGSMAKAAHNMVAMGYDYLALGGMAVSNAETIQCALEEIRKQIPDYVKLHLLGFGKIDQVKDFLNYGIATIDTTSPMLRAFKDSKNNYFSIEDTEKLTSYTAIRIPQAIESRGLKVLAQRGIFTQEFLIKQEKDALAALRDFDAGVLDIETTLNLIMAYTKSTLFNPKSESPPAQIKLNNITDDYRRTLENKPWKTCPCPVCKEVSVEVIIFRASNRNKRRGMHNTWVFNQKMQKLRGRKSQNDETGVIYGDQSQAK